VTTEVSCDGALAVRDRRQRAASLLEIPLRNSAKRPPRSAERVVEPPVRLVELQFGIPGQTVTFGSSRGVVLVEHPV
jgi:hypothetical protein